MAWLVAAQGRMERYLSSLGSNAIPSSITHKIVSPAQQTATGNKLVVAVKRLALARIHGLSSILIMLLSIP